MDLETAREHVGDAVVYLDPYYGPSPGNPEQGTITSVGDRYVFVRYGSDFGSKATDPDSLELLASGKLPDRRAAETRRLARIKDGA
jgi:hypothetical protein